MKRALLFALPALVLSGCNDVGVIGGADGPTAILVTSSGGQGWMIAGVLALFVLGFVAGWLIAKRRRKK